jgi:hypothetical protein
MAAKARLRSQSRAPAVPQPGPTQVAVAPFSFKREGWLLLGVLAIAAILAGMGLTQHEFWDDEANTALFARNLRATGHLSAWDGTNLIGFRRGAELSPDLRNVYMPPAQYVVCALGQVVFGDTTFGGRFPFYLCGLLTVGLLFFFARSHLGGTLPPVWPALLVALSPAFALYIRQCRYYSLSALLSLGVLLTFALVGQTRRRRLFALVGGGLGTAALMFTNYLAAAALLASIPMLLLLRRYRTRDHYRLLGVLYGVGLMAGIFVLITANPFSAAFVGKDGQKGLSHFLSLLLRHLTGLGSFEFFPLAVAILLLAMFVLRGRRRAHPLVKEGLIIVLLMFVYSAVTSAFSPQLLGTSNLADMRYVVPLIPIGAIASACLLVPIWHWRKAGRLAAVVLGILLGLTNVLHLGFLDRQPVRSTLVRYLNERIHPYVSATSHLIAYAKTLPPGSTVLIIPDFMAYPAMYYVPQLHYSGQLSKHKKLTPYWAATLPDYVFDNRIAPDTFIVSAIPIPQMLQAIDKQVGPGIYGPLATLPGDSVDRTRPEIPWHGFEAPRPEKSHPFVVIGKITPLNR